MSQFSVMISNKGVFAGRRIINHKEDDAAPAHIYWHDNPVKTTNVSFRHEGVVKIKCPQNLDQKYFSRWKKKVGFSILRFFSTFFRFWDFWEKNRDFSDFQFCLEMFEIFRFCSRFSDLRICWKIFSFFLSFRIFRFSYQKS